MPDGLRGEWWIDDSGGATFADGDIGDQNHEIIAFWAALGVDFDEAFESLCEELTPYKRLSGGQASVLLKLGADPKAVRFFSGVEDDARTFMMVEHAWIRVADNNFQLWNLDDEALGRIRDFINNEYPEDEDPLEDEFQIEELRKDGVHLSVSGSDLLESGKSADALKYSAQRERTGRYNPPIRHAWEMSYDELLNELNSAIDKKSLDRIRPLLAEVYPEYANVNYFHFDQDPWGIGRAIQVGTELPRIPTVDLSWRLRKLKEARGIKYIVPENNPEMSERTYYEIGHRGLKSKLWYGDEFNITVEPAEFDIDETDVDPRNLHNEWALRMPWHGRYDPYSGEVSIMGGTMTEEWRQPSEQMLDRLRETFGADVQIVQFNPGAYNLRRGFR